MWLRFFCKTWVWVILTFIAFVLCLYIEYNSTEKTEVSNRVILGLSYSYMAAAIFHYLVNYLPNRFRKRKIKPYIENKLFLLKESLRQCKNLALPVFNLNKTVYTKGEYIKMFSKTDFYDEYELSNNGHTKLARFEFYRDRIIDTISVLLEYREFISDKQFVFLANIQKSPFIVNGLCPNIKEGNNSYCNQDEIGECVFELYEQSKKII